MGKATSAEPVKLFIGVLTGRPSILPMMYHSLEDKLGPIDYKSDLMDFGFTHYYEKELGPGLKRQFVSFQKLISPEKLAEAKLFTNEVEQRWSEEGRRLINLDPGYVNGARIVLASTKDFSQRIYLGQGIYAEITLLYRNKRFEPLPWTYPDFRSEAYQKILLELRATYMKQTKAPHE